MQWCIFCCTVQAILWLEFIAFFPNLFTSHPILSTKDFLTLIIGMLIPIVSWVFIKPHFLMAGNVQPLRQQLRAFKYNAELFQKRLSDEVKYNLPNDEDILLIGNSEAENVITIISNPFCQPCAKTHKLLDELICSRDDVKLQTVFYTTRKENDKKTTLANYLMSLQAEYGAEQVKKALNEWYEGRNFDTLLKKYPLRENFDNQGKLEIQRLWFQLVGATATPAIYINGRSLPYPYRPEDIKYLI